MPKHFAYRAAHYRANRKRYIQRAEAWNKANPERRKQICRKWGLKGYGLLPSQYEALLSGQRGGCAICGTPPPPGGVLCVDHDHVTKKVRGLLCQLHNTALGLFKDRTDHLAEAIKYLRHPPCESIFFAN